MAKDRFKIPLKCPDCGLSGVAKAEEEDGWAYVKGRTATTIQHLPEGFKVVAQKSAMASVDIYCENCDVSAIS